MATLDCVLIGYSTEPIDRHLELAERVKDKSAGYQHLLANTARFMGKRGDYFDVINRAVSGITGQPSDLHFAKVPNLAAILLANYLRKHELEVEIVNYFNGQHDLLQDLLAQRPNTVAITTTFYIDNSPVKRIVDFIRQHSPETKIVVGGPRMFHFFTDTPRAAWSTVSKSIGADIYVNDSQGELTLANLCIELRKPTPDLSRVANLVIDAGGALTITGRQPENNDMNSMSISWKHFLSRNAYPVVTARTARSCAFRCAFCRYPLVAGDLNLTDVEVVARELDEMEEGGVRYAMFIDDTFNIPQKRFKDLCRMMIGRKSGLKWLSYFRCANADEESFDLAAEAGCVGVFLGIESASETVLRAMNKGAMVKKYFNGIRSLNERNIISYASFILGHPGETRETVKETVQFIRETAPTYYSVEPYYHDPKVPIAKRADEFGLTGAGYSWRHNGMDWREATEISMQAYESITESTILPLNNFDLWSIGYLMGQGISRESIHRTLGVLAKGLIRGLRNPHEDLATLDRELTSVLRTTEFAGTARLAS